MDILWPALGIAAIVVFVFYVLAQHWQRLLQQQTWTIRRLAERVQSLEEMADPEFRRRLSEASPVPLEQVFTLSFRLDDHFFRDALHATEENLKFIREYGSFVGSVKLERWRSHTVATINEVLPDRKVTGWQTRSLDFYSDPAKSVDALTLWELALSRPGLLAEHPPSLELRWRANSLELCGHLARVAEASSRNGKGAEQVLDDVVFFPCSSRYGSTRGVFAPTILPTARARSRTAAIQIPHAGGNSHWQRELTLAGVLFRSQRRARLRMAAPPPRLDQEIRMGAMEDSPDSAAIPLTNRITR